MTTLPRGTCRVCGKSVPIRRNGELREHHAPPRQIAGTLNLSSGEIKFHQQPKQEPAKLCPGRLPK